MKVCNAVGCKQNVWAENFCKLHQWMRSDIAQIKREGYALKKQKSLKKYSEKGLERQKEKAEKAVAMWKWIKEEMWDRMGTDKYCQACGKPIKGEMSKSYFHHLLPKSKYENLAREKENIFFCCFSCHEATENGFPHEKIKIATDKAKIKYGIDT